MVEDSEAKHIGLCLGEMCWGGSGLSHKEDSWSTEVVGGFESLSWEKILKQSYDSQSSLDLILSSSMVMIRDWWRIGRNKMVAGRR